MLSKLKSFVLQSTLSKNWTGNPQKKKRQERKKVKLLSPVQLFVTPWTVAHQAPQTMGFSRQARVGCHFLLQEIFWTQGLNPGLPHCRQTLYHLRHQGGPCGNLCETPKEHVALCEIVNELLLTLRNGNVMWFNLEIIYLLRTRLLRCPSFLRMEIVRDE